MLPQRIFNTQVTITKKSMSLIVVAIVITNVLTICLFKMGNKQNNATMAAGSVSHTHNLYKSDAKAANGLYLLDQASKYVVEIDAFEKQVKKVARTIDVPAEWLMAIMYNESKFDASAVNSKNQATGLVQWQAGSTDAFGLSMDQLRNLDHTGQLNFMEKYFKRIQKEYKEFTSLTELYLAVKNPEALKEDYCYVLYDESEQQYNANFILDSNEDGRITIKDIDQRMKTMYPSAYLLSNERSSGSSVFSSLRFW